MKHIINFVKAKWTDQVWSKVFGGIILAVIGFIVSLIFSLFKKIPFGKFLNDSFDYLKNTCVKINLLTIVLIILCLLIILLPLFFLKIISIRLSKKPVPDELKTSSFNIVTFLDGGWLCEYSRQNGDGKGGEHLEIKEGNKYYLNKKLYFILTEINITQNHKLISWTKTAYPQLSKHSRETLNILDNDTLEGVDDTGYNIKYTRKQYR